MTLGKFAVFTVGVIVGGTLGYAAIKSDTVRDATKSTIKATLKAKDWTVDTLQKASNEVKEMVKDAKAEATTKVAKA